jgi:uncharacterized protein
MRRVGDEDRGGPSPTGCQQHREEPVIHPHTELRFIRPEVGWGVVATRRIPAGTVTWVLDPLDQRFEPEEVARLAPVWRQQLETYAYRDAWGRHVLCWDHARFVNHSFRSTCLSTAYDFELAVRDIEPGEELTDDYGYLNVSEPFECLPERGVRRRVVLPDDLARRHRHWDRKLRGAFRLFEQVEQPLAGMLPETTLELARRIARGESRMASIRRLQLRPAAQA